MERPLLLISIKAPHACVFNTTTPLSGNAYKLPIFETLIRRAILAAGQA